MPLPVGGEEVESGSRRDVGRDRSFPRENRLTARRQFLAVYGNGRRTRSPLLTLFGLPNKLDHCRLGITVTRKVGCAVRRNRIKRMLREVYRLHRHRMGGGIDLVVNAHHGFDTGSMKQVEREFLRCYFELARRFK